MKLKAKLVHKYNEVTGTSKTTGEPYRSQTMKFVILSEDGSETRDELSVYCNNTLIIDAPAMEVGATGFLGIRTHTSEYNGKSYNNITMMSFTPQKFSAAQSAAENIASDVAVEKTEDKQSNLPF